MSQQETIAHHQAMLTTHRRALRMLLRQCSLFGPALIPLPLLHALHEVRQEIERHKAILHTLGAPTNDDPDDADTDFQGLTVAPRNSASIASYEQICGDYVGFSHKQLQSKPHKTPRQHTGRKHGHSEYCTIALVGTQLCISGSSVDTREESRVSFWNGAAWRIHLPHTYYFGLELTYKGTIEYGNLIVTYQENRLHGHYHSCALHTKHIAFFTATKHRGQPSDPAV
jgi:hypothetical protein